MTTNVLLALLIWFLTCACSVVAIVLAVLARPRYLMWSLLLALAATLVSIMGLAAWTPFGILPEVGYSWSNGSFEVSMRSGWTMVIPLVLAGVASFLAIWRRRTQRHEA
jgi:hypothetical protein